MTDKIVVLCTCSGEDEAERLARSLVGDRLAACVSVVPKVRSFYRWKGELEEAAECLLIMKTSRAVFDRLREAIQRVHSYDVPEIVALPITDGAANYLDWIGSNLIETNLENE